MGKNNLNEISNLFELHMRNDASEINETLSKIDGAGKRAATRMLYMRLLAISANAKTYDQNWILKPNKPTCLRSFEDWFINESSCGINSKDLLIFFKASTYKASFKFLVDNELIFIDQFNRMWLKYPFGEKMLSLNYAAVAIKASYKKETSLDTQPENSVKSDVKPNENEVLKPEDDPFWKQ